MIPGCYEPLISEEGCVRIRLRTLGCYTTVRRVTRNQHQFPEILVELREVFKKGYAVMAVREQERWREGGGESERLDHSFSATKARALVNLNFSLSALTITSLDELAYPRG
jgi:hypothetical protein